ncbi:MAG TPA: hypothetical protein VHU86_00240 [Solirubrobacterales bacterium]|jgi:hypothetical protein|nr:hypothetical protein [Solirubrobacterales bacterium]
MNRLAHHITYANVTSTLALTVALAMGTAYAANQLAPKSVGAKQLRPGAVTADKIRKNAVTAPKIEAQAVKQGKIANGAVTGEKIANGVVGSDKIPSGAVTPDKIPDNSLTGAKIDESTLAQVPTAKSAAFATTAETANPEAFAKVDGEGTVFPANSKGIGTVDVKQGLEPGIYCINVPGFVPRGAQVTPEYAANNSVSAFVKFGGTVSCPFPQVEVQTYNSGSRQKEPFYFMAYR